MSEAIPQIVNIQSSIFNTWEYAGDTDSHKDDGSNHSKFALQLKKAQADGLDFNLINKPITGTQILSITRSILNGSCEYLTAHKGTAYEFKLFISGRSVRTEKTIADIKGSLKASLPGRYTLDIIDVIEKPDLAYEIKVMMTPTLVKTSPPPVKSIIGNFSNGHFLKML